MEYYLVAYKSRSHTAQMFQALRNRGIVLRMVNTPRQANVGCGVGLRMDKGNFEKAKGVVKSAALHSFAGFFKISIKNGKLLVQRI